MARIGPICPSRRALPHSAFRTAHSALALSLSLALLAAAGAGGGESPLKLEVLRAEAQGSALDVLLRLDAPSGLAEELAPSDFAVYVAPADLSPADAAVEGFRIGRVFLKRLGNSCYLDLRQLPTAVGGTALQLLVQVSHGGKLLASHHLAQFLGTPPDALDVVLVIDESLSMTRTDPDWRRIAAAKAFVDMARRSTRIGHIALVAFHERARTLVPLTPTTKPEPLYEAINRISSMGQTDMDAALAEAQKVLERSPSPNKVALLLSDGKDEPSVYENAHRAFADKRWRVYTVGLSKQADTEVLQRIATDTGGDYHCAPTNAELQDIFSKICITLHRKVPIRAHALPLQANVPAEDALFVDDTISALGVGVNTVAPDVAFVLRDPANRLLTPDLAKGDQSATYNRTADSQHYDLWSLIPGRCVARLTSPRPAEITVSATAVTPLLLRAFPLKPVYLRGEPIELSASLANADALLADARVEARIQVPGGTGFQPVTLYDDGQHSDTGPSDGVFAGVAPGCERAGQCLIQLVATGTTPAGHRFERELQLAARISAEGYATLWASAQRLDFGVLYNGESASQKLDVKLISALGGHGAEKVESAIADFRLPISIAPSPLSLEPGPPAAVTISLRIPPGQPAGRYSGTLELASKYDKLSLPVVVEVQQPKLVLDKAALDLGAIESGSKAEAVVELKLDPRGAVRGRLTASDPRLTVSPPTLDLGSKPASVRVTLASTLDQPTEAVKAKLVVESPIGKVEVPVVARVVRPTFAVTPAAIDFGEVSPGQTVERQLTLSLEGLVPREAELRIADFGLPLEIGNRKSEIGNLVPGEPSAVQLCLRVPPTQPPGSYRGEIVVRTPLGERKVACTANVLRLPHQSIAFEPAELDVGRLQAGIVERFRVSVNSLVDEPQSIAIENVEAPAALVAVSANLESGIRNLESGAARAVTLTLAPAIGPDDVPFEATVTARGRSLPASLRVRGTVFTPPGKTFAVVEPVLDFGLMTPGQRAELALALQSAYHREQKVSLGDPPSAEGVALAAERGGTVLLPGVMHPIGIELAVAPDASSGERRLKWEVRGPGDSAVFEVRVEVIPAQAPAFGRSIATTGRGPLGWLEGALLFVLLLLLLAIMIGTYFLARWLLRSTRVPRMARYFAVSAVVHVAALFVVIDLILAHKVQKQEIGPLFRVGLKAVAAGDFSGQQASAADEVRAQSERERRLDAERRQQGAARLARDLLEGERRKLDPTMARLEKPKAEEKLDLAPTEPDAKKLTVEDLAQIMEELRDPTKVKEAPKAETREAAPVEAARVAELRSLTREQLQQVVQEALQPKAAGSQRAAAAPQVPGLEEARTGAKTALAPEELVPAMEALKQDLGRAEGAAKGPATPDAGEVQAQKATQGPVAERGTGPGERLPTAEAARSVSESAPRKADIAAEDAGLSEIRNPQSAIRNGPSAAPPAFATPEEPVAPIEGIGQRAADQGERQGAVAAREVTASRPGTEAAIERAAVGGERVTMGEARVAAEAGRPAPEAAATAAIPRTIEGPTSQRRPAPVAFATPDEQPTVDPLVELPGTPREGRAEPAAVAVARVEASGGESQRPATAPAPLPASPGRRGVEPAPTPVERPAIGGLGLPQRGPEAGKPGAKVAPKLDGLELVEGPLIATRQEEAGGGSELGPQAVVAAWRLRPRGDEGRQLAMAGGSKGTQLVPRVDALERPATGGAVPVRIESPGGQRQTVPDLAETPQEAVAAGPRKAEGVRRPAGLSGPGAVEARREGRASRAERGEVASAEVPRGIEARPTSLSRPVVEPARASGPVGQRVASGRPRAAAVADAAPEEALEAGPRVAARHAGAAPAERAVGASRAAERRSEPEAPRAPAPAPRQPLAPRATALGLVRGGTPSRLLLPSLAMRGREAGALVGDAAGTVRNIVLTTIKYGGGEADWDCHRTAFPFLAWQLRERVGFNLETDVVDVPLSSSKIMNSPWIFMTGHKDFRFTDAEVASLRRYVLAGGTLWAEDCTNEDDPTWDRAFRREIARVFPPGEGDKLRKITKGDDHPLFRSCFDLSQGYRGYWPPPGDKFRLNYIEGIELNGRLAVIYTHNDYGCGLEIRPDTHPGKVSLSGLSPAEMQESSFLMASNIVLYALTGGRGVADRGLAGRAANSLRRQLEAAQAQGDPYEKAPATLFDNFAEERWVVEETWDKAGPAALRPGRRADPKEEGKRLAVSFQLGKDKVKTVLIRDLPQETDLSGQDRCYVDIESRLDGGARLAIALITMPDWKYCESLPAFIKPGRQRVFFDLRAPTWKTGEPVAEGESEYCRRPANLNAVRRFVILLYPVQPTGTVVLDRIEFRSKP